MKVGKRMKAALESYNKLKAYPASEAMENVLNNAKAKFDETIELHVKLGVDGRNADQQVRGVVVLPHGTGKSVKVLVVAKGDKADEAVKAGADFVGAEEMVAKIQGGWLDFDIAVATPDMMKDVGRLGMVLGRKGLMPNPKTGTVTNDIAGAISELKKGRTEFRADKTGVIHLAIGKVSMDASKIAENAVAFLTELDRKKPQDAKQDFVKSVSMSSTMGPGVWVNYTTGE